MDKKTWLVYLLLDCETGSEGWSGWMYHCVAFGNTDEEIYNRTSSCCIIRRSSARIASSLIRLSPTNSHLDLAPSNPPIFKVSFKICEGKERLIEPDTTLGWPVSGANAESVTGNSNPTTKSPLL